MKKIFLFLTICCILFSCSMKKDIDDVVSDVWEDCKDSSNCVIDFSNIMGFEWDTMYYYSNVYALDDIVKDLGFNLKGWTDIGERVIFFNKGKEVYQKEWFPIPDKPAEGIVFVTDVNKFKISKQEAKFRIKKRNNLYFLEKL